MIDDIYDHQIKILLIGESGVGKSCLIQRFTRNEFNVNHLPTIAIDFKLKIFEIEGVKLKMQIWDTAGQERFNTLTSGFFRGAHGIIVTYSIADKESLHKITKWMDQIKQWAPSNVKILILGNKADLIEEREVSIDEGEDVAKKFNVDFREVSAFTGDEVDESFIELGRLIKDDLEKGDTTMRNLWIPKRKKGCCK